MRHVKAIEINRSYLRERVSYDPETGIFTARNTGRVMGTITERGRRKIKFDGKVYFSYRLAWFYMTGEDPGEMEVDHIDGNRLNDSWSNLRLSTRRQNQCNVPTKGYHRVGNRFRIGIVTADGQRFRQYVRSEQEAIEKVRELRREHHGDFTRQGERV